MMQELCTAFLEKYIICQPSILIFVVTGVRYATRL